MSERPSSALQIRQRYEGHGIAVPPPLDRGFPDAPTRPPSAAAQRGEAASEGERRKKKVPAFVIHVHLREKVVDINAGEGKQRIFWLAVTAVQRYLADPDSYSRAFSEELTPKGVLSANLEWIDNRALIKDELANDDHVWVDVGDGMPISDVQSRPFNVHQYEPDTNVKEEITWEVDPEDNRRVMRYHRSFKQAQDSFESWRNKGSFTNLVQGLGRSEAEGDLMWRAFQDMWNTIDLSDLPGYPTWTQEVQALMWRYFEQLSYLFHVHAAKNADGNVNQVWLMGMQEFWNFCKLRRIPTPTLNLAKIDTLFVAVDHRYKDQPHNPRRSFVLYEFLEGLIRLAVMRQKDPRNPAAPLPDCLEEFMQEHVLADEQSYNEHQALRLSLGSPAVRKVYNRHARALFRIFAHWSRTDEQHATMSLPEWLAMFKESGLIEQRSFTRRQAIDVFVLAQLDELAAAGLGQGEDGCDTAIYQEFEEAIGRAALAKFESDKITSTEAKIHEFVELLIASRAGVVANARPASVANGGNAGPERVLLRKSALLTGSAKSNIF